MSEFPKGLALTRADQSKKPPCTNTLWTTLTALRFLLGINEVSGSPGGEEGEHWDNKHGGAHRHLQRDHITMSKGEVNRVIWISYMEKGRFSYAISFTMFNIRELKAIHTRLKWPTYKPRYDIKMYPTFIHLHGKTFDYKIPASTVMRLFLLPHKVENVTSEPFLTWPLSWCC